jgi:hypothetical protein
MEYLRVSNLQTLVSAPERDSVDVIRFCGSGPWRGLLCSSQHTHRQFPEDTFEYFLFISFNIYQVTAFESTALTTRAQITTESEIFLVTIIGLFTPVLKLTQFLTLWVTHTLFL